MSALVFRKLTPRLVLLLLLLVQPLIALAGSPPTEIIPSTPVTKTSSADITVPTNSLYKKARPSVMKKGAIETASPSPVSLKDESQAILGPGGTPTPICPVNDSRCPDVNGMNGGVKLTPAEIAANCPEVCSVSRTGSLTTGDTFPVCPSGYALIGSYNVQKEWAANALGSGLIPQLTNNPATFKSYWDNKSQYFCTAQFEDYGGWACLAYQGDEMPGNPINYDVLWWDQCVDQGGYTTCWGMNNNGDQPYAAAGIFPLWNSFSINNTYAAKLNVTALFNNIIAANKVPAVWAAMDNHNMPQYARSGIYETPGESVPGYCRFRFNGNCVANKAPETIMITYSDSACTQHAWKKSVCGQMMYGDEPEHHARERNYSGSKCNPIYIKVRVPVYSLSCSIQAPPLVETGRTIPTSLLCGRIKPTWQ